MSKKGISNFITVPLGLLVLVILLIVFYPFISKFLEGLFGYSYQPLDTTKITPIPIPNNILSSINKYNNEIETTTSNIKPSGSYAEVNKNLVKALIAKASNTDPRFISDCGSVGLMQIKPETAVLNDLKIFENSRLNELEGCKNKEINLEYSDKLRKEIKDKQDEDIIKIDERFNPALNIKTGINYLSLLLKRYNNNEQYTLAAYYYSPNEFEKNCKEQFLACKKRDKKMADFVNSVIAYKKSLET